MPILVRCTCGKKLSAPDTMAGKRVACPSCKATVDIPAGTAAAPSNAPATNSFIVSCTCGQQFTATPDMAGMQSSCPTCGSLLTVPGNVVPGSTVSANTFPGTANQAAAVPAYAQQQYVAAPSMPANDGFGAQSPFGPSPGAGAWNAQAAPPNDPLAAGLFSSAHDQRNITLPPMPAQATWGQAPSHTLGAASTTLPNGYAPGSPAYPPAPEAKKDGWAQIGGGIGLMALAVIWFCGGLFFGVIFPYAAVLFIFGIILFVKGIIGKLS